MKLKGVVKGSIWIKAKQNCILRVLKKKIFYTCKVELKNVPSLFKAKAKKEKKKFANKIFGKS